MRTFGGVFSTKYGTHVTVVSEMILRYMHVFIFFNGCALILICIRKKIPLAHQSLDLTAPFWVRSLPSVSLDTLWATWLARANHGHRLGEMGLSYHPALVAMDMCLLAILDLGSPVRMKTSPQHAGSGYNNRSPFSNQIRHYRGF